MEELLKDVYGKIDSFLESKANVYSEMGKYNAYEQIKKAIGVVYYTNFGKKIDNEIDFIIDVKDSEELDSLLYELACKANEAGRGYSHLLGVFDKYFELVFKNLSKEIDQILEDAKMIQNDVQGEQYQQEMDEYVLSLLERIEKVVGE